MRKETARGGRMKDRESLNLKIIITTTFDCVIYENYRLALVSFG